jgi:carboxyvinyl-carboxyphosphonate phosphorylmutase
MSARRTLRTLIEQKNALVVPGAYDGVSARLVERAGFPAVYMTGYGTSASRLGLPDLGYAGLAEMADHARNLAAAVAIPLIADADTGYGNALNTQRAVREFERAGVAGIHIGDQVWPKRCGHMFGKRLIAKDEMVGKLKAALDARHDADFVIIARCDAIMVNGIEDTLDRGEAYLEAGADMLFFEMRESMEEMRAIADRFRGRVPLHFNHSPSGMVPRLHVSEIEALGFKTACFYVHALMAACKVMREVLTEIKETGNTLTVWDRMVKFDEFWEIAGLAEYRTLEKRYGA